MIIPLIIYTCKYIITSKSIKNELQKNHAKALKQRFIYKAVKVATGHI